MFNFTKSSINLIVDKFKKWCLIFKISFSLLTLSYMLYSLMQGKGNTYINIALIALYIAYTVVNLTTSFSSKTKKEKKQIKKIAKKSYKWSKLFFKGVTLASTIYGIVIATSDTNLLTIIFTAFTVLIWILQVILEIAIWWISKKIKTLYTGVVSNNNSIVKFFKKDKKLLENEREIASENNE